MTDDPDVLREIAMEAVLQGEATDDQLALLGIDRATADAEHRAFLAAQEVPAADG
jgi:hypothetical protein